jgi:hypothetical protein
VSVCEMERKCDVENVNLYVLWKSHGPAPFTHERVCMQGMYVWKYGSWTRFDGGSLPPTVVLGG